MDDLSLRDVLTLAAYSVAALCLVATGGHCLGSKLGTAVEKEII